MSVNQVILLGFVGKSPEIRSMNNGKEVALFSLATSESWKDKQTGEKKEKTEWHRIVVYGNLVNIVKNYVHKGSKLYINGKIQTRKYTNKQGIESYTTEVILQGFNSTLKMLDSKGSNNNSNQSQSYKPTEDTTKQSTDFDGDSFIDD